MKEVAVQITYENDRLADFCRRHNVGRLMLYGSVLSDRFGPESDVDVLVEFEPGKGSGLIGLADMETELVDLFGGREVDLVTAAGLSRYIRDQVLAEAEVCYGSR